MKNSLSSLCWQLKSYFEIIDLTMAELPEEFTTRLQSIIPAEKYESVINAFTGRRQLTVRINTLKNSIEEARKELEEMGIAVEQVEWMPEAFIVPVESKSQLSSSPAFNEGRIYIQAFASMLAAYVLEPEPGETVLDLAAAPGGKTLHIAAKMQNEGKLSAVEAVKGRFFKLKANLDTYGATMVRTFLMDGRAVGKKCPEMFDRILLDAPCSSEARIIAGNPKSWEHWSERKVKEAARKQKGLISSAWHSLKPGGRLVYCTCSFAPEENELAVQKLIKKFGDQVLIEDIQIPMENIQQGITEWGGKQLHPDLSKAVRVLPNEMMDGFFMISLRKEI
ncbi:MAG: RsmB/NOP family class I SAM-dependent RNA methyltransferase [Lentisphaerales bacterium]|nr:RsmB/NOP family class I SAM-dependent RNA methyltransferase [Lentisphaerales bacterium]